MSDKPKYRVRIDSVRLLTGQFEYRYYIEYRYYFFFWKTLFLNDYLKGYLWHDRYNNYFLNPHSARRCLNLLIPKPVHKLLRSSTVTPKEFDQFIVQMNFLESEKLNE